MYKLTEKNELVENFLQSAKEAAESSKMFGDLKAEMTAGNADMAKYLIERLVKAVEDVLPEVGVAGTSKHISFRTSEGTALNILAMSIKNVYSANESFSFKRELILSENIFEELIDYVRYAYAELVVDALVKVNLEVANEKFEEITKAAGNSFKVRFVTGLAEENRGKTIAHITNEEVVYVADEDAALNLSEILVFADVTELITEDKIKQGFDMEVAAFAQAQTTPQMVAVHDPLVDYLAGVSKLVKAFTLIKKVYSKNVEKIRGNKATEAYFKKDDAFAVIAVSEDGTREVILNPFNVKTMEAEDIDVLAAM